MYWRLSSHMTACIAGDRVIVLDTFRDRYLAIPDRHAGNVQRWLRTPGQDLADPCRQLLVELGISAPRGDLPVPEACAPGATIPHDPEWFPETRLRPTHLLRLTAIVLAARRDVRLRRLGAMLDRRFDGRRPAACPDRAGIDARLAEFRSLRPFVPVPRICLQDSLALIEWLRPTGATPELVLGVAAFPFAAHCWVQWQGRRLDDHPDDPSRFEPILHLS